LQLWGLIRLREVVGQTRKKECEEAEKSMKSLASERERAKMRVTCILDVVPASLTV